MVEKFREYSCRLWLSHGVEALNRHVEALLHTPGAVVLHHRWRRKFRVRISLHAGLHTPKNDLTAVEVSKECSGLTHSRALSEFIRRCLKQFEPGIDVMFAPASVEDGCIQHQKNPDYKLESPQRKKVPFPERSLGQTGCYGVYIVDACGTLAALADADPATNRRLHSVEPRG